MVIDLWGENVQWQFSVTADSSVPAAEGAEAQHLSALLSCFFAASISLQVVAHPEGAGKERTAAAMEQCAEWALSHQAGLGTALCHAKHLTALPSSRCLVLGAGSSFPESLTASHHVPLALLVCISLQLFG